MNATFRRDYLYQTTDELGNLEFGSYLRYLRYDRSTKSYLFLTGRYKNDKEELISLKSNKNIKRLFCHGYELTNGYTNKVMNRLKGLTGRPTLFNWLTNL